MKKSLLLIGIIAVLILTSCKADTRTEEQTPVTEAVTPTPSVAQPVINEPSPSPSPSPKASVTPIPYADGITRIRWVLGIINNPTTAEQNEINRLLQEKGYPYRIEFIHTDAALGKEYLSWLTRKSYQSFDILSTFAWSSSIEAKRFTEEYLTDLSGLFATEKGKELYGSFTEMDWDRLRIDGSIYSVPSNTLAGDHYWGLYLSVNERYQSYFESFDGTYESLRRIRSEIGDGAVIETDLKVEVLYGLLGYASMGYYPYSVEEHRFVNPAEFKDELNALVYDLYCDLRDGNVYCNLRDGTAAYESLREKSSPEPVARLYYKDRTPVEGYRDILLTEDLGMPQYSMAYGVSKDSLYKEEAAQVLAICYSDPEISAILRKPMDVPPVDWEERLTRLRDTDITKAELYGFIPEINEKEFSAVNYFGTQIQAATVGSYYCQVSAGEMRLREDYPEMDRIGVFSLKPYEELFAELNRQASEYRKTHPRTE